MKFFRQSFFRVIGPYNLLKKNSETVSITEITGSLAQHTDLNQHLSDHRMFINNGVLNWNMMMQAKERAKGEYNNGFRKSETKLEYQTRLRTIAQFIAYNIANDPSISCISLQEAPVDEVDLQVFTQALEENLPSEWKGQYSSLYVDHTSWGIFTLVNKNKIKCDEVTREEILNETSIKDIDIRCRTYSLSQNNETKKRLVTTLHLPHGDPESAFRQVFKRILSQTKNQDFKDHDIVGDYNIPSSRLKELIDEELEIFKKGEPKSFDINVTICPSIDGHIDMNRGHLTVDHQITLKMTPSIIPCSSVNYIPRSSRNLLSLYLIMALTTTQMMFTDLLDEDEENANELSFTKYGNNF